MAEKKTLMQNMMQTALDAQSATEKAIQARDQAKYDKAFEDVRSGKQPVPRFNDMGPTQEEVAANRAQMREAFLKGAQKGMGGKELEKAMSKKKGGAVKKMAKGGSVSSASKRADGCATKGKTKGRII